MSSGFRNIPPRLQLREKDNLEGKNPTVARSGMRTGVFTSSFNDTSTIIFDQITKGTFPQMLPVNSQYVSASYITGAMAVRKYASDSLINFYNATPGFGPFVEHAHFEQSQDPFFLTTSTDPRFDEKLRDKVAIRIDISAAEDHIFTRAAQKICNTRDPQGRFLNRDITGFSYFNFARKKWEMIGLTDPETGGNLHFDTRVDGYQTSVTSGTNHWPSQFIGYDGSWTKDSLPADALTTRKLIGSPTVTNFAPFANKYHATSSQLINISDYINEPFFLEKVVVNLPIMAERKSDSKALSGSANYSLAQDDYVFFMYRQEQSYFITASDNSYWTQPGGLSRHKHRSKSEWATGSMRYIICSGVMTFYNNLQSVASGTNGSQAPITWAPVNTPAFKYDFNVDPTDTTAQNAAVYTGSVQLNITPAVASPYMAKEWCVANTFNASTAKIVQYWPGGTTCLPFGPEGASFITSKAGVSGKAFLTYPGDLWEVTIGAIWASTWKILKSTFVNEEFGGATYSWFGSGAEGANFKTAKRNLIEKLDQRTQKPLGGNQSGDTSVSGTLYAQQSAESGYVVLPGDKFVIGIEAALGYPSLRTFSSPASYAENYAYYTNTITGSVLTVGTGSATITLYGSYIKEGKPTQAHSNQFLTSDAVSETIFETISDQFIIYPREQWAGSYTDNIFSGTFDITKPQISSRNIFFSDTSLAKFINISGQISNFNVITDNYQYPGWPGLNSYSSRTVSFPRRQAGKLNLFSSSEILYDTMLPGIEEYIVTLGAVQTSSYVLSSSTPGYHTPESAGLKGKFFKFPSTGFGGSTVTAQGNTYTPSIVSPIVEERNVGYTNPYPYKQNPDRPLVDKEVYIILTGTLASNPLGLSNSDYFEWVAVNQDFVKEILFTRGSVFSSNGLGWRSSNDAVRRHSYLSGSTQTKYGIASIKKHFSKQIYRHDNYGQFRDMLEGRKFTTFYDVGESSINKKASISGKVDGPVVIKFWNRENESFAISSAASYLSGSSNRSVYATSSMPYIDGEYYNWSTVL